MNRSVRFHLIVFVTAAAALAVPLSASRAQARVGRDSATRLTRFGRDAVYGIAEGLAFAGVDQIKSNPPQWGTGWSGYEKRAASNVGEFLIQEGVTEGLAAAMNRPLDYEPCRCHDVDKQLGWALRGAVTDRTRGGHYSIAVPRIVGAYAGSFAQAAWLPAGSNRAAVALLNGTTSLAIGALINLYDEVRASR